jgi:nucleotide-binding universal stress UspA family protein
MCEHLAVAVDFSPGMHAMLQCLPGLRELGAERLTFVHVARLKSPIAGWVTHLESYEQKLRNEICPAMERDGFETDIVAVAGDPGEEITRIAMEREVSLVLVGSRGGSPQRGRFLGSVAWDVVQRASLPVLVQRVEPASDDEHAPLVAACCDLRSRVLFPTDRSEGARRALEVALVWGAALRLPTVQGGGTELRVVHLVARGTHEGRAAAERELQAQDSEAVESSGVGSLLKIRIDLREGKSAAGEILRIAGAEQSDLLVLGTHGRSSLGRALIGSVSSTVTRQAEMPVLLVPPVR